MTLLATMTALTAACDDLCVAALRTLDPALAARLAAGARPYVALRLHPLVARVLAESPNGESLALADFADAALPPALDAATAAFVRQHIDRLPPHLQATIKAALLTGARLAIIVTAFPPAAEIVLYLSADEAHVIARVSADGPVH
jgi:hypothetical protein